MHDAPENLHETPGEIFPIRFLGGGQYTAQKGRDFPPHHHTTWEMVYYLAGNILCPLGDDVFEGTPGVFLITPPFTTHAEIARTAYTNLHFTVEAPASLTWPRYLTDDADRSIEETCRALLREQRLVQPNEEKEVMLQALLTRLDLLIRRAAQSEKTVVSTAEQLVRDAEILLEERYAEQSFRIGQLARLVGASPSVLRAAFAEVRQYAPREALAQVRLRVALAFLRTSNLTLDAIAERCGYDGASHLSRHVVRATNASPGQLRKSYRS